LTIEKLLGGRIVTRSFQVSKQIKIIEKVGVTIIRGLLSYNLGQLSKINKHFGNTLLIEEPMDMIDPKYDDDSKNDGEILHEDGGTIIVKDWRRTSFFYSICIFKSKVYILIIDSGS